ncbi:MAG: DUF2625 family protein [Solirubrobacteraceae bacterium]|nr:DUF2625 family protein [Solirubrobacteraceae bacterium]
MTDDERPPTESAWPDLAEWLEETGNLVDLLPAADDLGEAALASLDGVDETSALGALARHAAAVVVDDWLILLGAGSDDVPGIREFNGRAIEGVEAIPGALVVGIDRLGGAFAINAGGLPEGDAGEIVYLAPDDLTWMRCGFPYSGLLEWALEGDVEGFYADVRWPTWREESAALGPNRGFNAYPPPWAEPSDDIEVRHAPAPLVDVWKLVLATSLTQGTWIPAGNG